MPHSEHHFLGTFCSPWEHDPKSSAFRLRVAPRHGAYMASRRTTGECLEDLDVVHTQQLHLQARYDASRGKDAPRDHPLAARHGERFVQVMDGLRRDNVFQYRVAGPGAPILLARDRLIWRTDPFLYLVLAPVAAQCRGHDVRLLT